MPYEDDSRKVSAETRRAQVLGKLLRAEGAWVPGPELADSGTGGSEGLRRVRDLRAKGWKIEGRRIKGRDAWEYRLIGPPDAVPAPPPPPPAPSLPPSARGRDLHVSGELVCGQCGLTMVDCRCRA
jgi:hypothetical protein